MTTNVRRVEVLRGQCAGRRGDVVRDAGDSVVVHLDGERAGLLRVYGADNVKEIESEVAR